MQEHQKEQEPEQSISQSNTYLKNEYDQLCEDWRNRDQYVLAKLIPPCIVFVSVLVGFSQLQNHPMLKVILLIFCILLLAVSTVSVTKDMYFNWGTQKLIEAINSRLGISLILHDLSTFTRAHPANRFEFPRRMHLSEHKFANEEFWRISRPLIRFLTHMPTFKLILGFNLTLFVASIFLLVLSVLEWSKCWNLWS